VAGYKINFWQGYDAYGVKWEYDKTSNSYRRFNGGQLQTDKNDGSEVLAKNVILTFMTEMNANDGYENNAHLLYKTKGEGKAVILQDGQSTEGKWQKKDRTEQIRFFDSKSTEIKFNSGQIWIEILPTGTEVKSS